MTIKGYYKHARNRAQRRKSLWNLLLVPLPVGSIFIIFCVLTKFMWKIHVNIFPSHEGRFNEILDEKISLLLIMPLFFASIPLGLMVVNVISWCILPIRKVFDKEAKGYKGTSFKESMEDLFKVALIVVPACLILSYIGASTLKNIK